LKLLIKLFTFTFVFISAPLYANNLATINIEYIIEKNIEFQNFLNNLNEEQKLMNDIFKKKNLQLENEKKEIEDIDKLLQPIHKSLFIESNPSPVKYAAKLLNLCSDDVRLPLVKVTEQTKKTVKKVLISANLI